MWGLIMKLALPKVTCVSVPPIVILPPVTSIPTIPFVDFQTARLIDADASSVFDLSEMDVAVPVAVKVYSRPVVYKPAVGACLSRCLRCRSSPIPALP